MQLYVKIALWIAIFGAIFMLFSVLLLIALLILLWWLLSNLKEPGPRWILWMGEF